MEPNFTEKERKVGGRVIIETLYNGISVCVDAETGYYYAGKICADYKKRFENLAQNQDYELMKQEISSTTGIPVVELECVFKGMGNGFRSKWIHPLLVHTVCEWADKKYAVLVSMLMNEIAKQAIIEKRTLQEQIDKERARTQTIEAKQKHTKLLMREKDQAIKRLKKGKRQISQELKEIREMYDVIVNQDIKHEEELKLTRRDVNRGNAKLDLISNQMNENHEDIHDLQVTAQHLAELVINQNSTNHSTGTLKFKIYFYTSHMIPKSIQRRHELNDNEIWLGCACGEKRFVKPRMPIDAHIVYKRTTNSRDMYAHIVENSSDYVISTNYRHMKIRIDEIDEFFNHIDVLLHEQGNHQSVRDLDEIHHRIEQRHHQEQIQAQAIEIANAQHQEEEELNNRKQELLVQYDNLHFILNGWKRKVYNENDDFVIRYGTGGMMRRRLTRNEIMNGRFTNEHDPRIKYE